MRLTSKGRYGLTSMVYIAQNYDDNNYITITKISDRLSISKIYLEQVFTLLRRSGLVTSIKGSQGGYKLSKPPEETTVYEILSAMEFSLFEKTEDTVSDTSPEIELTLQSLVYDAIDSSVKNVLEGITLKTLVDESKNQNNGNYMFFI